MDECTQSVLHSTLVPISLGARRVARLGRNEQQSSAAEGATPGIPAAAAAAAAGTTSAIGPGVDPANRKPQVFQKLRRRSAPARVSLTTMESHSSQQVISTTSWKDRDIGYRQ